MSERRLPKYEQTFDKIFLERKREKNSRESDIKHEIEILRIEEENEKIIKEHKRLLEGIKDENEIKKINIGKSHLDVFTIMQVLPYITDSKTMLNLILTTKKFKLINKRLRRNFYDLITPLDKKLFEHIDTLVITTPISLKPIYMKIKEQGYPKKSKIKKEYNKHEIEMMLERKNERDKIILRDILLNDKRINIEKKGKRKKMSIYDIGKVVAPIFKNFTNIKINIDFDWIIDENKYKEEDKELLINLEKFMIEYDENKYNEKIQFLEENKNKEIIIIPEDWKILPKEIFFGLSFNQIILNSQLFMINESSISLCPFLEKIIIPLNVQIIKKYAFSGCLNLKEIIFEQYSQLKIIETSVFRSNKIKQLILPEKVKEIGWHCFYSCKYLEKVRFPPNIKIISRPFCDNPQLKLIEIPIKMKDYYNEIGEIPETVEIIYY